MTRLRLLLLLTFCIVLCDSAAGQSATATLTGTVVDEVGAVVPGVAVSVINPATSLERTATTSDAGYFTVPLLPPGNYTLTARRDGFAPVRAENVVLNVGDQKTLQIQIKAGSISEMVKIISDTSLIDESPMVATVVDRQFVENLPLNGRSFQSLLVLAPGVVLTKTSGTEVGQFSVNGQRANANYFTVDGVSANIGTSPNAFIGQSAGGSLPGLTAQGGTNNLASVDALQEFRIQTSTYAPEFGRTPGAQVSIVTRSGTNDFRGTVFEYFRNDALDANDFFANSRGLPKPPLSQHDFGFVLGGPLLLPRFGEGGPIHYSGRNRSFFFLSYEALRLDQPQTAITEVPSLELRQSAPASMRALLNGYPIPNGPLRANGFAEFAASYSDPSKLNATSIRLDHIVNSQFTLFGRYNYAPSQTTARGGFSTLNTVTSTQINTRTLTVGATLIFNSSVTNDLRFNYSRNVADLFQINDNFGGASPPPDSAFNPPATLRASPQISFGLLGGIQARYNRGPITGNTQRQINLIDNLSVVTGTHQLRFGVDYRRLFPIFAPRPYLQQANVSLAGARAGTANAAIILTQEDSRFPAFANFSLYGQDTWRASPRLTLTYGLRWEVNPAPKETSGNHPAVVRGIDNPANLTLEPDGTPLYETTYGNFAPRVGVAYLLSERQNWQSVIRGGFGVFYDLGNGTAADAFGASVFPYTTFRSIPNVTYPLTPAQAAPPVISRNPPFGTISAFEPELELPRAYQWNLSMEQAIGAHQTVTASYVAAAGRRLLRQEVILNPNPSFTRVNITRNTATSDYHSMQLQFQRRLSRGLQALASYTWSHSIDNASDDSGVNSLDEIVVADRDRGPSSFDVRHSFTGAVTYNLPAPGSGIIGDALLRNWAVDSIVRARSATTVNVFTGASLSGAFNVVRPNLLTGVPLYIDGPALPGGRQINRAAFVPPATGQQGSLGRNALRGFPAWQVDFALRRQFDLTERVNLQFRAEFFNVFNHPNFGDPIGDLRSALFGQSTQMLGRSLGTGGLSGGFNPLYQIGGPRSTQLAVKLNF